MWAATPSEVRLKSVRAQLLVGLVLVLGLATLIAGYGIFRSALEEANELFDYELRSIALSLPPSVAATELATRPDKDVGGLDDERVVIQIWDAQGKEIYRSVPSAQFPLQKTGFHSIEIGEKHFRVFGVQQSSRFVQLAQPTFVRDELALKLASRTLWPLLAVLPFEIAFVLLIVRRALRPVNTLSKTLAARSVETLQPIEKDSAVPTEVQPLVDALNGMLIRLRGALQSQRVFVADAAHELRTPLTALKLQIQAARRDGALSSDPSWLQRLEERVNRAIHLVQQLLALAREDAEFTAREGTVDLPIIASHVIGELSILAEDRKIDLGLECVGVARPNDRIIIRGDENSLTTLLTNLVDNALRYAGAGGRVDVRVIVNSGTAAVEVIDDGPGIPPSELERVLDRFYRAANTTGQGSGLGLAIAAKIAAKHGASFEIQNRTDRTGLRVRVSGLALATQV
jgi:two-component system OmpR family sensor kinase